MAKEDNLLLQECNRVLKKGEDLVLSVPVGYVYLSKFFNCENGFCGSIKKYSIYLMIIAVLKRN